MPKKLTNDDVRLIREMHRDGRRMVAQVRASMTAKAIAAKFDVHTRTIEKVLTYETWGRL